MGKDPFERWLDWKIKMGGKGSGKPNQTQNLNQSSTDLRNFFNFNSNSQKPSMIPTVSGHVSTGTKRKNESSPSHLRLESKIDQITSHIDSRMDRMENLVQMTLNHTNTNINNLLTNDYKQDLRLNDLEQARLNPKMEISGHIIHDEAVKRNPNTLRKYTLNMLNAQGHELTLMEISDVYYFERRNRNNKIPVLLVTFLDEGIKRRIMRAKLNPPPIFFSNVLTKSNNILLMAAKKMSRAKRIHSAWTTEDAVFIKLTESGNKMRIIDLDHLNELCSSEQLEQNYVDSPINSRMNEEIKKFTTSTSTSNRNRPVTQTPNVNFQQHNIPESQRPYTLAPARVKPINRTQLIDVQTNSSPENNQITETITQ